MLILTIIADHPEGNDFCGIFRNGCRVCCNRKERTKMKAEENLSKMIDLFNTRGKKAMCYKFAQQQKQHILMVCCIA
jgi:hypothetical protein